MQASLCSYITGQAVYESGSWECNALKTSEVLQPAVTPEGLANVQLK